MNGILIDWREEKLDIFHMTSLLDLPTGTVGHMFPNQEFCIHSVSDTLFVAFLMAPLAFLFLQASWSGGVPSLCLSPRLCFGQGRS